MFHKSSDNNFIRTHTFTKMQAAIFLIERHISVANENNWKIVVMITMNGLEL